MTAATPARRRVAALLALASSKTASQAATAAKVDPSTIVRWRQEPAFADELAALKEVVDRRPMDGRAIMAQLAEAEARLTPARPPARPVRLTLPAGASPGRRRQFLDQVVEVGLAAVKGELP
ncbi:hypothetical protein R6V09_01070 [Streptomyces sp. W16]|uniref:hypothetical protein n=1 Tax=Streptomyces sp. W16 TaxID=3076631 RepID=UPI00295AF2BF|nr:hypothetical protein [Streptomyces sp. W16]MDV9168734.1 hypothetical protein [Streptomyces sp. W16]